jgi:uncharacterized membrane protein
MSDDALEQRLAAIEARLAQIELSLDAQASSTSTTSKEVVSVRAAASSAFAALDDAGAAKKAAPKSKRVEAQNTSSNLDATRLLGWSGATALVLAALYLIRLGIDSGWLTPLRQLGLAAFGGGALIVGGLLLRRLDRQYAALLPAAGVVVLFATVYGAHLYYGLIDSEAAVFGVVAVALLALWLGALFESEVYALFAVLGSYTAPIFLPELRGDISGLTIYFSVWSLAFSFYALKLQRRSVYLLAMYLALIVFSFLFEKHLRTEWQGALLFQTLQFAIFLGAAVLFSLRNSQPMSNSEAGLHFPALLLFYTLQYNLLDRHLPDLAAWIALGSAAALLAAYLFARERLGVNNPAARSLVSAYLALVLVHAVYMNLLPDGFGPWFGLALILALRLLLNLRTNGNGVLAAWPFLLAGAAILLVNVARILLNADMDNVPASGLLLVLYPALGYFSYLNLRRDADTERWAPALLILAHLSALTAAAHLIHTPALVSVAWLVVASLALAAGFKLGDRQLGQSSLLLFLLAGLKIMLFDLADTTPLLRVGVLLVLGVSLYAGGWVYRKLPDAASGSTST